MSLLLDTHTFLWWITDSPKLSARARAELSRASQRIHWSAASTWEVGIKYALGRLPLPSPPREFLPRHLELNAVTPLPITDAHAFAAAALPRLHDDPFDRLLVAQAQVEGWALVSGDPALGAYGVPVLW